jgi:small subunit ribosomal protein S4
VYDNGGAKLMARYNGPSCKLCRREGEKLFLKGDRCYSEKCAISKRAYLPGEHGQQRKKLSEYGMQLREKQKARRFYGVLEKQFRNYFDMATSMKGVTGENLLRILESRLDNVVYRLGLAASRPEARQLVRHNHFCVNGKRVNIPSYLLKPGDIITVSEKSKGSEKFKSIIDKSRGNVIPKWLEFDPDNITGKVIVLPSREDIDISVQEHLIVELYSK